MRTLRPFRLLPLLGAVALILPPAATAADGTLHLRFAWPKDRIGELETHKVERRNGKTVEEKRTSTELTWEQKGGVTHIRSGELRVRDGKGSVDRSPTPAMMVDDKGIFVGVDGAEGAAAKILDQLAPNASEAQRAKLMRKVEQQLEVGMREAWQAQTGFWANRKLPLGELVAGAPGDERPLPVEEGVPLAYRYGAVKRTSCNAEDDARSCVLLRFTATVAPRARQAFLASVRAQLPPPSADGPRTPPLRDVEVRHLVELVASPSTLLPHRLRKEKEVELIFEGPGGAPGRRSTQTELEEYEYSYRPVASAKK